MIYRDIQMQEWKFKKKTERTHTPNALLQLVYT